jgi:hypothetical protein
MNNKAVKELLKQWIDLLVYGKKTSKEKAESNPGGIDGRIRRTTGRPVIFDSEYHAKQLTLQDSLCKELPQWADVISSQPEIMDGYEWTRKDFIDLYFGHFLVVIEKLNRIVKQTLVV